MNRTSNKHWEKTSAPTNGSMVIVSGYFEGDEPREFLLEVETMNFITPIRGSDSAMLPQTPGRKSRFGIPKRSAYMGSFFFFAFLLITL